MSAGRWATTEELRDWLERSLKLYDRLAAEHGFIPNKIDEDYTKLIGEISQVEDLFEH